MYYQRRFLQFNELVFDGFDMVNFTENRVDFKVNTQERSYGHGSYVAYKQNYLFAKERDVSLTITLEMKKLPCEYRPFYKRFAVEQIVKPGKLWSLVNNELMWAYAHVTSYGESEDMLKDQFVIDIDFLLPEGVWHKADKQKTFLAPYDVCTFMDCKGYRTTQPCCSCDNCVDNKLQEEWNDTCCCCCDELTKDMALCNNLDNLQDYYAKCNGALWQIVYDCERGQDLFGDKYLGDRVCTKDSCSNVIAGTFYSETEVPTTEMDIVIDGTVHNPAITINDNTNVINGDYKRLRIKSNGDVYSESECCSTLLDPSVWSVPSDNNYGWVVNPGNNRVVVDRGSCCGFTCIYVNSDNLSL